VEKSDEKKWKAGKGLIFSGYLTMVFLLLRIFGVIDWSWWWVASPILITTVLWILVLAVIGGMGYYMISTEDTKEEESD